jgi:hypothetical protein
MEKFSGLIAVLLEHSQRFFDIWNLQIVIALGVLGFSLTNQQIISKVRVRLLISAVFIAIAAFSVFSLSAHQRREEKLWNALEARVASAPSEYIPEEKAYIDVLKPTPFDIKAGAIVAADVLIILVIWFSPKIKEE